MEEGKEGAKEEGKAEEGEGRNFGLTMPPEVTQQVDTIEIGVVTRGFNWAVMPFQPRKDPRTLIVQVEIMRWR